MAIAGVNGAVLSYEDGGTGAPAFVFIPGGAADHRAWAPQTADLSRDYRCIAVDLRGAGDSAAVPPCTLQQAVDDVAELVRVTGSGPAIVVGHSIGGLAALLLNERYPALVTGSVLVDTPIRGDGVDFTAFAAAVRQSPSAAFLADQFSIHTTAPEVAATIAAMAGEASADALASLLDSAALSPEEIRSLVKTADQKPFMTLWPVAEDEPSPSPFRGRGGDPLWLRDTTMFVRQEPVPSAGHYVQLEKPAIVNALLRAFVDDVRRDPRLSGQ